jgi:hypothetical protein
MLFVIFSFVHLPRGNGTPYILKALPRITLKLACMPHGTLEQTLSVESFAKVQVVGHG